MGLLGKVGVKSTYRRNLTTWCTTSFRLSLSFPSVVSKESYTKRTAPLNWLAIATNASHVHWTKGAQPGLPYTGALYARKGLLPPLTAQNQTTTTQHTWLAPSVKYVGNAAGTMNPTVASFARVCDNITTCYVQLLQMSCTNNQC